MDAEIISLQFALFMKDIVSRPDLEFSDMNEEMLNIFDTIPTTIPVPDQLPPDVPVKTHRSKNNEFVYNISRSRIDFIRQRVSEGPDNNEMLKDFNIKVQHLTKYVLSKQECIRFGLIAKYFVDDNQAIKTIADRYFKTSEKNIGSASELSVRYNNVKKHKGFEINDIVDIASQIVEKNQKRTLGIIIQRDINNKPDSRKAFTFDSLKDVSSSFSHLIGEGEIERLIK